jgi:cellulose synthase/poly-beta-1,6-N-acetylglucosamine synthase-like glycosyltransferase
VIVLERQHADERGKGYALRHAFRWSRQEGWAQAVVVIDADTTVAASTLRELAARLAAGEGAVQADYRVRNSDASWRTRLLELAFTLHHTVRSLGRERLGWSCGLRGNGMALSHATLERAPYEAFSIVEDLEYGIVLGLAGIRVSYAARAEVRGDMPTGGGADARGQRARWEVGRRTLRHRFTPILWRSWHDGRLTHRKLCGDLLADLLTLPLVTVTVLTVLGGLAATAAWLVGAPSWGLTPWAISLGALLVYLVQGVRLSASPAAALRALLAAPIFIGWKLVGRGGATEAQRGEWVRTARAAQP